MNVSISNFDNKKKRLYPWFWLDLKRRHSCFDWYVCAKVMSILKDHVSRDFRVCEMQIRRMQISSGYIRFPFDKPSRLHFTRHAKTLTTPSSCQNINIIKKIVSFKRSSPKILEMFFHVPMINTNTNRNSIPETGTESINQHRGKVSRP